jgi:hypothetical protein
LSDKNFVHRNKIFHPRLQAKIPKILGYELYPDFDYYFWLDGNFSLASENSVMHFVKDCENLDACFFLHPQRTTVKEEFDFMFNNLQNNTHIQGKYQNECIKEQYEEYQKLKDFDNQPLYACGAFVYNKSLIFKQEFNLLQQWFYHNCRYSVQDQLSLPYLLLKNKEIYKIGLLEKKITKINKYVLYHRGHK